MQPHHRHHQQRLNPATIVMITVTIRSPATTNITITRKRDEHTHGVPNAHVHTQTTMAAPTHARASTHPCQLQHTPALARLVEIPLLAEARHAPDGGFILGPMVITIGAHVGRRGGGAGAMVG